MLPVLKVLGDNEIYSIADIKSKVKSMMSLSDEDLKELLPSGRKTRFEDRVE